MANRILWFSAGCALAFVAGFALKGALDTGAPASSMQDQTEREPLYWVAPMDPNYRRDKAGKSPMGMDLVPVYEDAAATAPDTAEVRISPAVVNNLGVRTAAVERRTLARPIQTVGYVGFDEDKLHHVHLRLEGWIERLGVTSTGDFVEAGETLFHLYSPQLIHAQEELLIALADGNRILVRAARAKLGALGLSAAQVKTLESSRRLMETVPFRSAQRGFVSALNVRHGMFVRPDTEIMSIGQLDSVWVIVEVFERQSAWVQPGQPVRIRVDAYPGRDWRGEVDYVYPVLDPTTRTSRVRIRVANEDQALRPNMFASINIDTGDDRMMLAVPRDAVIRTGTMDRVVLALGQGRFRPAAVEIGRVSDAWIEILDGVAPGQRVVTSAQFLIDSESGLDAAFSRMTPPGEPAHGDHPRTDGMREGGRGEPTLPDPHREMPGESSAGTPAMDHQAHGDMAP